MALKLSNIESAIAIIVSEVSAGKIKGFNFDGKELYQKIKSELMDSTKKDITYEHLYKLFENQYHIYKGTDDKNDKNKNKIPSIFLNICNLFKLINPISEHIYLEQSERQLLYKHIHFLKNLPSQVSEIIIIFLKVFNRFNDANLDEASNLFCNMKTSDDLIQAFINLIALSDIEINSLEENNLTVFKKILEHSTWASEEESNFFKNSFYQLIQCSDLLSKNKCLSTENISTLYDYIKGKNGSSDLRLEYTRLLVEANEFNAINLADCAAIESEESPEFILNIIKKLKGITSAKFTLDIILDALVNPFSRGKVSAFIDFISKISSHKILDQNDIKCLYRNIDILIDAKDFAPEVSVLSLKSWGQLNDHNLSKFLVLTSSEDNVVIADNIIAMINQWRLESNCEYIGSNNIVGDFKSLSNSHGKLYCNVLLYEIANIFRFANLLYSYNILTSEKIDLLLRYIKGEISIYLGIS